MTQDIANDIKKFDAKSPPIIATRFAMLPATHFVNEAKGEIWPIYDNCSWAFWCEVIVYGHNWRLDEYKRQSFYSKVMHLDQITQDLADAFKEACIKWCKEHTAICTGLTDFDRPVFLQL